jgi:hypothetical protein
MFSTVTEAHTDRVRRSLFRVFGAERALAANPSERPPPPHRHLTEGQV